MYIEFSEISAILDGAFEKLTAKTTRQYKFPQKNIILLAEKFLVLTSKEIEQINPGRFEKLCLHYAGGAGDTLMEWYLKDSTTDLEIFTFLSVLLPGGYSNSQWTGYCIQALDGNTSEFSLGLFRKLPHSSTFVTSSRGEGFKSMKFLKEEEA